MRIKRYRPIVFLFLMVHVQACSSWQLATLSPPGVIEAEQPQEIRITRTNGEQVTIQGPAVWADSIAGTEGGDPVKVGLSDIQQVEVKRGNVARVGFLVVVAAIGVSLVMLIEGDGNDCRYGRYCN